jgi:peptide/nickel transport system substrate-binding protein
VPILPREVERTFKDFNRPEAMIGSGPFMAKSFQKGVRVAFERNPDYYARDLPYLDGVVIEIRRAAAFRLWLLRSGNVDLGHVFGFLSAEEAASIKRTNPDIVVSTPILPLVNVAIYFRTDQPPFDDLRVRRAISLAIDRKSFENAILHGHGCIDAGPVPCAMKHWKLPASTFCSGRCRAAWHRRRHEEAREARDREIRALLQAALRKLGEISP